MKTLITNAVSVILLFSTPAHAKDDARVTYLKVKKVTIEETVITIVVEEAKTQITLIKGDYTPLRNIFGFCAYSLITSDVCITYVV